MAFNRRGYRFGAYGQLATERAASALCHDLYEFAHEFPAANDRFHTFMATFPTSTVGDEIGFEQAAAAQLMHEVDTEHFQWSDEVSSGPPSAEFSFSLGGRAFFVVVLSPVASRHARVTPWPVIVFSAHDQFERLRDRGKYESMHAAIRTRDMALQGNINWDTTRAASGT